MILGIHIFSGLFFVYSSLNSEESLQNHVRLLKNLLGNPNYDKRVIPVANFQHAINISMEMQLFQIIEINEPAQYLQLYVTMVQTWHDELLTWDPTEYGGLDTTILPHNSIWIPDTYLFNILEMVREKAERWSSVNVKRVKTADNTSYMRGCNVYFRYPAMYRFTCHMEIFYFPFDVQICNLTFGSLTYDSSALVYFPMDVNVTITSFVENQEWTVVEFKMFREQVEQCCGQPVSLIQARLILKRKPLYYVVNLIVPAFIVTIISFVGFFTPDNSYGERKDKVTLGISTLLAMSVLLMSLSDTMPTTSKYLPVMGMFYLCIIVLISLATLMASLVLKLDQKSRTGPTPRLFRTMFFKRLSALVFANIPSYQQKKRSIPNRNSESSSTQRFGRLFTLNGLKGRWIFGRRRDGDGGDQLEGHRPAASKILTQWCCELHDVNLMILKENQKRESILASDGPWFVGVLERMLLALAVLSLFVVILILFCFS